MKKRVRNSHISNRLAYTLITIGILLIVAIGVYALGAIPNPGHLISQLQTCDNNQILETVGGVWTCVAMPSASAPGPVSGGLYGRCVMNQVCLSISVEPGYCIGSGRDSYCGCRAGYNPTHTGDYGSYSNYACIKT